MVTDLLKASTSTRNVIGSVAPIGTGGEKKARKFHINKNEKRIQNG